MSNVSFRCDVTSVVCHLFCNLGWPHTNCVKTTIKTWDKRRSLASFVIRQHHDSDRCAAVFISSFVSTVLLSLRHVADLTWLDACWCAASFMKMRWEIVPIKLLGYKLGLLCKSPGSSYQLYEYLSLEAGSVWVVSEVATELQLRHVWSRWEGHP
jgi:hypothetical protein